MDYPSIARVYGEHGTFEDKTGRCPHCLNATRFERLVQNEQAPGRIRPGPEAKRSKIEVGKCPTCNCFVVGIVEYANNGPDRIREMVWPLELWKDGAPDGLEAEIRATYDEARAVLALSPKSASLLARRCLQHIIRHKLGIQKKRLFDEIEEAAKREELSKPTRDCIGHIREIGNYGAHPEKDEAETLIDVSRDEAEHTLIALEMVFGDIYVATGRATSMRARLESKRSAKTQLAT